MQGCWIFLLVLLVACASTPTTGEAERALASSGPVDYALEKLRQKGAGENYLALLERTYEDHNRSKVLELNLLGFLKNRPKPDLRIPGWELERVDVFLKKNKKVFREIEQRFPVPKEVIASLLWVETKYGRDAGTFHVGSSFLSIAQADFPTILEQTMETAKIQTKEFTPDVEARIISRSKSKAEWAVNELMALEEVHESGFKNAETLRGSFSGAFGMAQFLPSSYLSWAKGRKKQPNLFQADDSIYSVANYLSVNGWKSKDRVSHQNALFHYNRDINYVNRILKMSECLKSPKLRSKWQKKRKVAAVRTC
jgi:membrane-bound lytic murein transglycosylase B